MIKVETSNGKIECAAGMAKDIDLMCEAVAAISSVVRIVSDTEESGKCDEQIARKVFRKIVVGVRGELKDKCGIDVLGPVDDEEESKDDEPEINVCKVPMNSKVGKKIMELLNHASESSAPGDDETEDDLPDFLF